MHCGCNFDDKFANFLLFLSKQNLGQVITVILLGSEADTASYCNTVQYLGFECHATEDQSDFMTRLEADPNASVAMVMMAELPEAMKAALEGTFERRKGIYFFQVFFDEEYDATTESMHKVVYYNYEAVIPTRAARRVADTSMNLFMQANREAVCEGDFIDEIFTDIAIKE